MTARNFTLKRQQRHSGQATLHLFEFKGHLTPETREAATYIYLPFDVPDGVSRIEVRYDFTRAGHAAHRAGHENIIDIGLFDPRGHDFNSPGFRGWSGSARAEFFITPHEATPGFVAGPIPPGTWHIILGLYRVAPGGCACTVTITLTQPVHPVPRVPTPAARSPGILRSEAGWYRGDLHAHTHHSDARLSVAELAGVARAQGLDFLAITDHNTISHLPELSLHSTRDLLLIPGVEVTTYYGHANVWGLRRWLDFRCHDVEDVQRVMKAAHAQGALFSINHPYSPHGASWEYGWIEGADAVEVWHGPWYSEDDRTLAWWDELLQAGRQVVAVGGSDWHPPRDVDPRFLYQVGIPTTWVYARNLSVEAVLAGMRAGHTFITATVDGPQVRFRGRTPDGRTAVMGDVLTVPEGTPVTLECEVRGAQEQVLELIHDGHVIDRRRLEGDVTHFTWTVTVAGNGYARVQVIASRSQGRPTDPSRPVMLALTNPVYIRTG